MLVIPFSRVKLILTLLILSLGCDLYSNSAQSGYKTEIIYLSNQCILKKELQTCQLALRKIESFQLYASSQSRYVCQTRLIGLQNNLIMTILNSYNTRPSAFKMLNEVQKACNYL